MHSTRRKELGTCRQHHRARGMATYRAATEGSAHRRQRRWRPSSNTNRARPRPYWSGTRPWTEPTTTAARRIRGTCLRSNSLSIAPTRCDETALPSPTFCRRSMSLPTCPTTSTTDAPPVCRWLCRRSRSHLIAGSTRQDPARQPITKIGTRSAIDKQAESGRTYVRRTPTVIVRRLPHRVLRIYEPPTGPRRHRESIFNGRVPLTGVGVPRVLPGSSDRGRTPSRRVGIHSARPQASLPLKGGSHRPPISELPDETLTSNNVDRTTPADQADPLDAAKRLPGRSGAGCTCASMPRRSARRRKRWLIELG